MTLKLGAHMSAAGGVSKAFERGQSIGCDTIQIFTRNQNRWDSKPLDPADVARAAATPEMAAEMYLASVLMVDEEHFMERAYLEELARQLQLAPALKSELEAQVRLEAARV